MKMIHVTVIPAISFFLLPVASSVSMTEKPRSCESCALNVSTCQLVSGLFTRPQLPVGYNLIAQIPQGACNINITELKQSRNYLALRTSSGSYVINGNWAIAWSGEYPAAGTSFIYSRHDLQRNNGESIFAPGPIDEPVDIMVIYQQPNPGIAYQYKLPLGVQPGHLHTVQGATVNNGSGRLSGATTFNSHIRPGPTSRLGSPEGHHRIPELVSGRKSPQYVSVGGATPDLGDHDNLLPDSDEFEWRILGFTPCSKTCGGGEERTRIVCVQMENSVAVPESHCDPLTRPLDQLVRCNMRPCPATWEPGAWSECSVTCGEGIQSRDFVCKQEISPTLTMKVAEGACFASSPPSSVQPCTNRPCSYWETGDWGQCTTGCGKGMRKRTVTCMLDDGEETDPEDCFVNNKPVEEEMCDMGSCSRDTWFFSSWSHQCSEKCGPGVTTRRVHCSSGGVNSVPDNTCDPAQKPTDTKPCHGDETCGGFWFKGPWDQCSASCGPGTQTREVVCVLFTRGQFRVVLDLNCSDLDRPEDSRPCLTSPCLPQWYTTDWTQCSKSCDSGHQTRERKCLDMNQQPSADCEEETKPVIWQICNPEPCPSYLQDVTCVDRFRNCQLVVQARLCHYLYYRNACCHSCARKT